MCLIFVHIFYISLVLILIGFIGLSLSYLVFVSFDPIMSGMWCLALIALRIVLYGMSYFAQQNL